LPAAGAHVYNGGEVVGEWNPLVLDGRCDPVPKSAKVVRVRRQPRKLPNLA
jgi:hypothetical protein